MTVLASAAAHPLLAGAQQKAMPVIGFLGSTALGPYATVVAAFLQGLQDAGYVVGQNVSIEYRWVEGHFDRLRTLAADLVARKVDVIVTSGGPAPARAAKDATRTIPIVSVLGGDPVADGLIASLARPGGNVTGGATDQIRVGDQPQYRQSARPHCAANDPRTRRRGH
jgi:putative ABC transport system substrate-binding protein